MIRLCRILTSIWVDSSKSAGNEDQQLSIIIHIILIQILVDQLLLQNPMITVYLVEH